MIFQVSKEIKIALLMASSLFMGMLDGTIVITALPQMAQHFFIETSTASLLISFYLITSAIFIPLSAWLVTRYGKKRIWMLAVFLFAATSLGNAVAPNFSALLCFRVLQGISGALLVPTARLTVLEKTPPSKMLTMVNYLVWPALFAPVMAPLLGGFIVTYWSWEWIFLINIPIGIIILVLGYRWLEMDEPQVAGHFDVLGFVEIALASGLLLVGAEIAMKDTKQWLPAFGCVVLGIALGKVVFEHLKHSPSPLFSVEALKIKSFRICQTSGSVLWICVGALPYLMTIFLQLGFQWSAIKAGSYVLFIFVGNIGMKLFTTVLIRSLGYRHALLLAFSMVFVSSVALAFITPETIAIYIMFLAVISGAGRSLALTAYSALSFSEIEPKDRNSANTLNAVVVALAQGIGISIITVVVNMLQFVVTPLISYELGFIFLGLLMIFPVINVMTTPKDIGITTI